MQTAAKANTTCLQDFVLTYFRSCFVYAERCFHFVEPLSDVTVEKTKEGNNSWAACQRTKLKWLIMQVKLQQQ